MGGRLGQGSLQYQVVCGGSDDRDVVRSLGVVATGDKIGDKRRKECGSGG